MFWETTFVDLLTLKIDNGVHKWRWKYFPRYVMDFFVGGVRDSLTHSSVLLGVWTPDKIFFLNISQRSSQIFIISQVDFWITLSITICVNYKHAALKIMIVIIVVEIYAKITILFPFLDCMLKSMLIVNCFKRSYGN